MVYLSAVDFLTVFLTVFFAVFFAGDALREDFADFFAGPPSAASFALRSLSSSLALASVMVSGVSPRRRDAFVVPSVT